MLVKMQLFRRLQSNLFLSSNQILDELRISNLIKNLKALYWILYQSIQKENWRPGRPTLVAFHITALHIRNWLLARFLPKQKA